LSKEWFSCMSTRKCLIGVVVFAEAPGAGAAAASDPPAAVATRRVNNVRASQPRPLEGLV
jgi:hypothetical protein